MLFLMIRHIHLFEILLQLRLQFPQSSKLEIVWVWIGDLTYSVSWLIELFVYALQRAIDVSDIAKKT